MVGGWAWWKIRKRRANEVLERQEKVSARKETGIRENEVKAINHMEATQSTIHKMFATLLYNPFTDRPAPRR
jgi:hypothetical protein